MSSIEGSPARRAHADQEVSAMRSCRAVVVSAARLVGRVVAEADPLVLHRIVVGGLVVQRHRQMQIARGQPSDRRGDR